MMNITAMRVAKFSSVNLERNVLEDDSGPDCSDHLLEAGASLHLSRVEDIGQLQDVLAGDHDFRSERSTNNVY